jgi:DNA-binding MurR/RpiR family transcriptional regulator
MSKRVRPPATVEALRTAVLEQYEGLSKGLQRIARYILDHPNQVAIETVGVIAQRSNCQPSAVVRFAQSFGYDGALQMQRLFRDGLLSNHSGLSYDERVKKFRQTLDERGSVGSRALLSEFIEGNVLAAQSVAQTVTQAEVTAAVRLIQSADSVLVVGFRRSFPVASYLAYSLQQAGKRTVFLSGVGGMIGQQMRTSSEHDLLIAVSYSPYAQETVETVQQAKTLSMRVLAITDTPVSPIGRCADMTLQIRESEIRAFRTLSASLCLAQALVIGYAFESSRKETAEPVRPARRQ